jgi:hypothetical protein
MLYADDKPQSLNTALHHPVQNCCSHGSAVTWALLYLTLFGGWGGVGWGGVGGHSTEVSCAFAA